MHFNYECGQVRLKLFFLPKLQIYGYCYNAGLEMGGGGGGGGGRGGYLYNCVIKLIPYHKISGMKSTPIPAAHL